jgi:hypothetical protein
MISNDVPDGFSGLPLDVDLSDADDMLQFLVMVAHQVDMEVGITLTTTGGVVTGILVGRNAWLDRWHKSVESDEDGAAMTGSLRQLFRLPDPEEGETDQARRYEFIHLVDARHVVSGGRLVPSLDAGEGFLWRGQLRHVVGWSLVKLEFGSA